uniref:NADH dehydrogenase subunit 4L n=1 Tax=Lottia goshimai TaxID=1824450 RepID=UPI002113C991|nr:NADH dehydrogenase subunit 4L [Lottia goshimai]UTM92220.1 NADH dehydrogenase subunit 4L [Lottia peitaihoensis]
MSKFVFSGCVLGVILFLSGVAGLALQQKNLLSVLLYLEVCNVGGYIILLSAVSSMAINPCVLMTFICLAVCEASVGLGVVVMMARSHGNDYVGSVGILAL